MEVDFLLWYQRKHRFGTDRPTQVVFGEAKSFGTDAFKEGEVGRMRLLAERYPGAAFVFATLKEAQDLSKDEIVRIRKFAEWGREYDTEKRQTRAPVIVLTGTELFSSYSVEQTWKDKGGKHKQLVEPAYVHLDNLRMLADFTPAALSRHAFVFRVARRKMEKAQTAAAKGHAVAKPLWE